MAHEDGGDDLRNIAGLRMAEMRLHAYEEDYRIAARDMVIFSVLAITMTVALPVSSMAAVLFRADRLAYIYAGFCGFVHLTLCSVYVFGAVRTVDKT